MLTIKTDLFLLSLSRLWPLYPCHHLAALYWGTHKPLDTPPCNIFFRNAHNFPIKLQRQPWNEVQAIMFWRNVFIFKLLMFEHFLRQCPQSFGLLRTTAQNVDNEYYHKLEKTEENCRIPLGPTLVHPIIIIIIISVGKFHPLLYNYGLHLSWVVCYPYPDLGHRW